MTRLRGSLGSAAYRVYSQWSDHGDTRLTSGMAAGDTWNNLTTGARLEWARGPDQWTVDGSVRSGDGHPLWRFIEDLAPGAPPLVAVSQPALDIDASDPDSDQAWAHVRAVAYDSTWDDDDAESGFAVRPGTAESARADLTYAERRELVRLLEAEIRM